MKKIIRVVAAVVERDAHYLITQRRAEAVLPGLWEFPGGRVEAGESDEQALARELGERLGARVLLGRKIGERHHAYAGYEGMVELVAEVDKARSNPGGQQVRLPAPWEDLAVEA